LEVDRVSDRLAVSVSKPSRLRLFCSAIAPELANTIAIVRIHHETGPGEYIVSDGMTFGDGFVGWTAAPGRYEIRAVAAGP